MEQRLKRCPTINPWLLGVYIYVLKLDMIKICLVNQSIQISKCLFFQKNRNICRHL